MTQENSKNTWSANVEHQDTAPGQSLGAFLQNTRQKKQQTIQEVAETTRIPPETLEALEAGNKNLLPVAVFTRGFVKIYAAHLGLSQAEILERFSNEWGTIENVTPKVHPGERMAESPPFFLSFSFYFFIFLIALAISLAYFFFQAYDTPQPTGLNTVPLSMEHPGEPAIVRKNEVKQVTILSTAPSQKTLLISPQSAGKVVLEYDDSPQDALHHSESITHGANSLHTSAPDTTATSPQPPITKIPAPEIQHQENSFLQTVNLHIRFMKRTHISVSQDDDQPEKFIFTQGEESTWQAANHITLNIDNPDAVEMTLNGSPVSFTESNNGPLAITLPTDLDH